MLYEKAGSYDKTQNPFELHMLPVGQEVAGQTDTEIPRRKQKSIWTIIKL